MISGRLCDYTFVVIDRLSKKADNLNKSQLLNIFFIFNVCRLRAVDFDYEFALEQLLDQFDVDELAIVAMGYFKTRTKIKLLPIMRAMVERVITNSKTINEISLSAILKVILILSFLLHFFS